VTHPLTPALDQLCLQCASCKHFLGILEIREVQPGVEGDVITYCEAFPRGIPRPIRDDRFDHRNPYRGDHGIQWEPWTGKNAR
jgi:hypothetical protein